MSLIPIKTFLGLRTSVSEPEVGTAEVSENFRRNRTRGQLEPVDGFEAVITFDPVGDGDTYGISNFDPVAIKSFYVADQGGRTITVGVAKYDRTPQGYTASDRSAFGVWIRPYFNGSSWVDEWLELTEFAMLTYASVTGSVITVQNSPTLTFPADYFIGWTIMKAGDFTVTAHTGLYVTDSSGATLTFEGTDTDINTDWGAGTEVIYVYRNIYNKNLPASLTAQIHSVLDELRITSGSSSTDVNLALFYRDKSLYDGINRVMKGLYGEYGVLDIPSQAFRLAESTAISDETTGFPNGSYRFRTSLVTDDGQETELRDYMAPIAASLTQGTSSSEGIFWAGIVSDGTYLFSLASPVGALSVHGHGALYQGAQILARLNKDTLEVINQVSSSAGWYFGPVFYSAGFIYVVLLNNTAFGAVKVQKYTTSLEFVEEGINVSEVWLAQGIYFSRNTGAINSDSLFFTIENDTVALETYLFQINISTLGETANQKLTDDEPVQSLAANDTPRVYGSVGTTDIFRTDMTTETHITVSADNSSELTIDSTYVYVGADDTLYTVKISDDSILTFYTGTAGGWRNLQIASGYLHAINYGTPTIYRIIKVSDGSLVASLSESVLSYYFGVITGGVNYLISNTRTITKFLFAVGGGSTLESTGFSSFQFRVYISPGLAPRRIHDLNIYVSKDLGTFYRIAQYDLTTGGTVFDASSIFDTVVDHRYYKTNVLTLTGGDFAAASISYLDSAGRVESDSGVCQYSFGATSNNRSYILGRLIDDRLQRNRIYLSAISGDGVSMYDVFPNDEADIVDVEYNDGDYAVALANVADRILVLKTSSLVLLTPQTDGSHTRDVAAYGVGIAALNSMVKWNEALYWLDHTGVYQFTANGVKEASLAINDDILSYSNDQRAAALGTIDPKNKQYRLLIDGTVWCLDLVDGEWTKEIGVTSGDVTFYGEDFGFGNLILEPSKRRFIQLTGLNIMRPLEGSFSGNLHWRSTQVEIPAERGFIGLVDAVYCEYDSDIDLILDLYLDNATSPVKSYTLPATQKRLVAPAPLSATASAFRLAVRGTV